MAIKLCEEGLGLGHSQVVFVLAIKRYVLRVHGDVALVDIVEITKEGGTHACIDRDLSPVNCRRDCLTPGPLEQYGE